MITGISLYGGLIILSIYGISCSTRFKIFVTTQKQTTFAYLKHPKFLCKSFHALCYFLRLFLHVFGSYSKDYILWLLCQKSLPDVIKKNRRKFQSETLVLLVYN